MPRNWAIQPTAWLMVSERGTFASPALPPDYAIEVARSENTCTVRILDATRRLAASGYAAAWRGHYVYDRIVTDVAHRRRGLGRIVMAALAAERGDTHRHLLVATAGGRMLYRALGWHDRAPYASALIPTRASC